MFLSFYAPPLMGLFLRGEFCTCARPFFDTPSDLRFCSRCFGKKSKNAHTLRK